MRLLCNNIFNLFPYIVSGGEDDFFPISNIFNYQTLEVGRFKSEEEASLFLDGKGTINCFAIFNTNIKNMSIEIEDIYGNFIYYDVYIKNSYGVYNIAPIEFTRIKITFNKKADGNIIECGYFIIGEAVDFPPHDKTKTHTVNYTHEQYFSQSGHYFCRRLPIKSYDTWKVSFPYLTNADREKIINFFNENNFEPFVLQVWIEETIMPNTESGLGIYNYSKYGKARYGSRTKISYPHQRCTGVKYYMKSGLYVCTNEEITFKKGKNDLYQYSTELTFREIK
ncbi:hypothetical protein BHAMNSH16_12845 [Brachyspira hampsonii]|uniref:Uncharacterized protein n=2 Tax=Brachyspira hampsonii TaxID=1287055 RepID=A0AAC9XK82_9SPIR|nr:hypothetical protein [Brachyspira hampsonii]ASJ21582.1 hypothetical protein BHAMNSH16_07965 [Brachyspira hampsonii]ASJ22480.1 hypothetical protein BHAMNSH16_12845 [Brachyspira hampsonii]OEJ17307.1 hypothetical protein A9496_11470 [Brachyspira hampsonii]